MENKKLDEFQNIIDAMGMIDGLILVKNGKVTIMEPLEYGEVNIKFHNNKLKQLDTIKKIKY
ncbi:hypothetical protein [Sediminibacillus terrae]|uniref:hypothetical protein n=1 Tax=Sediminibacillus terrae TaxID=1562106 RepID=UPI0012958BC1|nr:hypothetical protein [Sediminibacillus terrae]